MFEIFASMHIRFKKHVPETCFFWRFFCLLFELLLEDCRMPVTVLANCMNRKGFLHGETRVTVEECPDTELEAELANDPEVVRDMNSNILLWLKPPLSNSRLTI